MEESASVIEKCWASSRGDCGGGISREHLVSRGLFPERAATVSGFAWCTQERRVGINSLARRVLCRDHNSRLSSTDEAIILLTNALKDSRGVRRVSGRQLERWFLKTMVNLSIGQKECLGIGMVGSVAGAPSHYLVDVAFGTLPFSHHMGIYFLSCLEPYASLQGEILFAPFVKSGDIGGALFGIAGVYFFLSLYPGHAPTTIGSMSRTSWPSHIANAELVYRPTFLEVQTKQGGNGRINLEWQVAI